MPAALRRPAIVWTIALWLAVVAGATATARTDAATTGPGCVVSGREAGFTPLEAAVLRRINDERARRGLAELALSPALTRAAAWKATAIAEGGVRAHDDPGRRWDVRLNDCGYDVIAYKGENLGQLDLDRADQPDPVPDVEAQAIVAAWQASPSHAAQLANPHYQVAGIARVRAGRVISWAVDFGSASETRGVRPEMLLGVALPSIDDDPCLPAGEGACTRAREALWRGEPAAWQPVLEAGGQAAIREAVLLRTLEMRADSGSAISAGLLRDLGVEH